MKSRIFKVFILIAILLGMIMLFSPGAMLNKLFTGMKAAKEKKLGIEAPGEQPVQVKIKKVTKGSFEDVMPVLGTVKGITQVDLRFEVNGVVSAFNFNEGDYAYKGDIIATLDQKDALLKLEYNKSKSVSAECATRISEKKLEVNKKLYEIGAIIKMKLEESQLEYESAKAQENSSRKEVEFAQAEVEKTILKAPMDAVLGTREVEPGEFVTTNNKVGTIFDITGVYVEAGIIEKDMEKVQLDQQAKINVEAFPNIDFWGKVYNIPSFVEGKSRTVPVKIRIDNPKAELKPGMFARAYIYVYQVTDTIVIPLSAAFDSNGDGVIDSVFLVGGDNIVKRVDVQPGHTSFDQVEILEGLTEDDLIIVEAATKKLEDGMKVEIIQTGEEIVAPEQ